MALSPDNESDKTQSRTEADATQSGIRFTDVFDISFAKKTAADKTAQGESQGVRIAGLGEDWGILSWRQRKLESDSQSITLEGLPLQHLKKTLESGLRKASGIDAAAPLSQTQSQLLSDAEKTLTNPRELIRLFTESSPERQATRDLVKGALMDLGLTIDANPAQKRLSLRAAQDSVTLAKDDKTESITISLRDNRLGADSMLFEKTTMPPVPPGPVDRNKDSSKDPKAKVESLSGESGRQWLADHFKSAAESFQEAARLKAEREQAIALDKVQREEAAKRRATNAEPVIQKAVDTAVDQQALPSADKKRVVELIQSALRLDPDALQMIANGQSKSGRLGLKEVTILSQTMENLGLKLDKLNDGSGLAIHSDGSKEALIISPDGNARLATKEPVENGINLNFNADRFPIPGNRQAKMADWLEQKIVAGDAAVEAAREKPSLERRYSRIMLEGPKDKALSERIADQKMDSTKVKNVAIDFLVSLASAHPMDNPAGLEKLLTPTAPGSSAETERMYFETLLQQAGLETQISKGASSSGGQTWLAMRVSTVDGKSFHSTRAGELTVFGNGSSDTLDATPQGIAVSIQDSLKATEHKIAVLDKLSSSLERLGLNGLNKDEKTAIERIIERSYSKSMYGAYLDRNLSEGLFKRLKQSGMEASLSSDRSHILLSNPKIDSQLAIALTPQAAKELGSELAIVKIKAAAAAATNARPSGDKAKIESKDGAEQAINSWLSTAKFEAEQQVRDKARSLEADKREVIADRAKIQQTVEDKLKALLPERVLGSKQALEPDKAAAIRESVGKLIASISAIQKEGVDELRPNRYVPWKIVGEAAGTAERQYFESCLRASGFNGRLIVDRETGKLIEGYRLNEIGSLREINIASSSLGFLPLRDTANDPLSQENRSSFRETVELSLKAADSLNKAIDRLEESGQLISASDRLAVQDNLRQVMLYANKHSADDGLARLSGANAVQRALTNAVLRRAGIEMYVFDHAGSGFADESSNLKDVSFRFIDAKSGATNSYDLGIEIDPLRPLNIVDSEPRGQGSQKDFDSRRMALAEKLSSFINDGTPAKLPTIGSTKAAQSGPIESAIEAHKLNALVGYAAQIEGIHQPDIEKSAAAIINSMLGSRQAVLDNPLPSKQFKQVLIAALETAGYQAAVTSTKEQGLSSSEGDAVDIYLWKEGSSQANVVRYRFDSTGRANGQGELLSAPVDQQSGRAVFSQLKPSESSAAFSQDLSSALKATEAVTTAQTTDKGTSVEFKGQKGGAANEPVINIYVSEKASPFAKKAAAPKYTDSELQKALSPRLDAVTLKTSGLDQKTQLEVKESVQRFFQAVKAVAEKGNAAVGPEISSQIPWPADTARHAAFVGYLKELGCDVNLREEELSSKTRSDTRYGRLMVTLPGSKSIVVLDSAPYIAAGEDQSRTPLSMRGKYRLRLFAPDAVDADGLKDKKTPMRGNSALKSFADFYQQLGSAKTQGESSPLEGAQTKLRVPAKDAAADKGKKTAQAEVVAGTSATDEIAGRVVLEKTDLDAALAAAEKEARAAVSSANSDQEREQAKAQLSNVEAWKGALADEQTSPQARQVLAENLITTARKAGNSMRQPAVLIPLIASIFLASAASAQTATRAPIYQPK